MHGWPATEASLVFRDRVADTTSTVVDRLRRHGRRGPGRTHDGERVRRPERQRHEAQRRDAQPVATRPFDRRLVGRQLGGRGRRTRHARDRRRRRRLDPHPGRLHRPARHEGHLRPHPAAPHAFSRPNTVVLGGLVRSVRDAARFYDVCAGYDPGDPSSLPVDRRLGSRPRHARSPRSPRRDPPGPRRRHPRSHPRSSGASATAPRCSSTRLGLVEVDVHLELPNLTAQWMMGNLSTLLAELGDRWPKCARHLTDEVATGLFLSQSLYNLNTAAVAEELRLQAYAAMAATFAQVDFVIAATNPDVAFPADAPTSAPQDRHRRLRARRAGRPARVPRRARVGSGRRRRRSRACPPRSLAFSDRAVPRPRQHGRAHDDLEHVRQPGRVDPRRARRRPAGRHAGARAAPRRTTLLFDVALAAERTAPWPLVATDTPR